LNFFKQVKIETLIELNCFTILDHSFKHRLSRFKRRGRTQMQYKWHMAGMWHRWNETFWKKKKKLL